LRCIEVVLKPKLVVVCNSKAALFTGIEAFPENEPVENVWMGYKFEFNDKLGVHMVKGLQQDSIIGSIYTSVLINMPFLFTSTLTYMSKYVKENLAWQISRVLKEI
jgi:hypothetical protein